MNHSWKDSHVAVSIRNISKALYITLGIFLAIFVLFRLGGSFYSSYVSENGLEALKKGIYKDQEYLKVQGDEVAKNPLMISALMSNDRETLLKITQQELSSRSIGRISVTDQEGFVLSRAVNPGKYGDNVFLTAAIGRAVATGKSVQSIEMTGFGDQIYMTTARPIIKENEMVGALFANYMMDSSYATRFKNLYLPSGSEVVFYTKEFGVFGSSFSNEDQRKIINSYFDPGSEWVNNGLTSKSVYFDNGNSYIIKNIVFPGLEKSPGGALVFIPRPDISDLNYFRISILILLIFLFFAIRYHLREPREESSWRYYIMLIGVSIFVSVAAFFCLHFQSIGRIRLSHIPYTLYNSTMHLQPEWGIYDTGIEQRFSILVETGDESINTVGVGLKFDPASVDVSSLETASSSCSYIVENSIDKENGKIKFSCVILNTPPGQKTIPIADIILTPKKIGSFDLSFDKENTQVLAEDGLGTDVLRMYQDGSYKVDNFDLYSENKDTSTSTKRTFTVFSPTHPNQSRWYNSRQANFVWMGNKDAVYKYAFDNLPDTVPSNENTIQNSKLSIPIPGDGIFYFHLQLSSGGPIAHYRIQSDMTDPIITAINVSEDKVYAGDVVRLSFDALDTTSGVQHNYYVDLGGHLFLPTGNTLFLPLVKSGKQKVTLRVYDGAGNYSEKTKTIDVLKK